MVQNSNRTVNNNLVTVLGKLMAWFLSHLFIVITYIFLLLAVLLCWLPSSNHMPLWIIALMFAIGFGLLSGVLTILSLPFIFSIGVTAYYVQANTSTNLVKLFASIILLVLGIFASMHIIAGFHNFKVLNNVYISSDAVPFNLYLNFDDVIIGIFIIGFNQNLINHFEDVLNVIKQSLPISTAIILILMLLALSFKFIHFDPKFPSCFWIWAPVNLFFTCVAEEAFYRGFLQKKLSQYLIKVPFSQIISIVIASFIFGFRHTSKFDVMILFAMIAGIAYGYAYAKTNRIETSIFVHFSFNLTHFLLFTYPALRHA